MTVTESPIEGAVETVEPGTISSHLHPEGSFDVGDFAVPTGLEEIWRFTPLKRLRGLHDDARLDGVGMGVSADIDDAATAGWVSRDHALRGSSGMVPVDRVSARAWAETTGMFLVDVPAGAEPQKPLLIDVTGLGVGHAIAGHILVNVGAHARATVVLRFEGSAVLADNVEIVVGDGAQLTLVSIEDWADDAVHHTSHHARVGRDARLKHVAVSFGGDLVRMDATAEYDGPGGDVEMLGLYFADAGQHLEHRLFVDHNEPRTRSHVTYKGALQGKGAHAVWIGNVLIRKEAEGIETLSLIHI